MSPKFGSQHKLRIKTHHEGSAPRGLGSGRGGPEADHTRLRLSLLPVKVLCRGCIVTLEGERDAQAKEKWQLVEHKDTSVPLGP